MNLASLQQLPPTHNESDSMGMWGELLMRQDDWRCYPSSQNPDLELLVARYLRWHATTPGAISAVMMAVEPMAIISAATSYYVMWGAVFLNGAVITLLSMNLELEDQLLFIDEETAAGWKYPDINWLYTPSMFSATPTS